jgi:diguanylate cyclase (GGDEF)-like protein
MNLATTHLERIKRQCGSAYVIILDIDFFKKVNDTYGHLVGDKVLKCTVDRVREAIRPYDLFGRYGGEEFIIFASDINDADIKKYTERIRTAICGSPMEFEEAQLTVSASLGVAPVDSANHLEEIIDNADKALYTAKHEGRNRVVFMAD